MLLSLPSVVLGAKRLGAKRLGGETTWGESTWGRNDLYSFHYRDGCIYNNC
jgi:hypothetical protein